MINGQYKPIGMSSNSFSRTDANSYSFNTSWPVNNNNNINTSASRSGLLGNKTQKKKNFPEFQLFDSMVKTGMETTSKFKNTAFYQGPSENASTSNRKAICPSDIEVRTSSQGATPSRLQNGPSAF